MNPHPLPRKRSEGIDFYSFENTGLSLVPLVGEGAPQGRERVLLLGKVPSPTRGRGNKLRCVRTFFRGKNH
jgi:hypothetical protein